MLINKYCFSCNKESEFYKNKNTGKTRAHCISCCSSFAPEERKRNESKNILKMLVNAKELNND